MTGTRSSLSVIVIGFSALLCLAVLTGIRFAASEEPSKTELYTKTPAVPVRGGIFDRNGTPLAVSNGDGRSYPEPLCPHLLGSLSADGSALGGIELAFDDTLRGVRGQRQGEDIYLTIDAELQCTAESILRTAAKRYSEGVDHDTAAPYCGKAGAAVVIDCSDGEVLALASYPDHKLESFSEDYESLLNDESSPLLDRALQGLYRPGSTFKTVTAAAALIEGAVSPTTCFWCGSSVNIAGSRFSCMKQHGYTDISKALELSCNIYFYRAALRLGTEPLISYASLFGYGEAPALELPTLSGQTAAPDNTGYWGDGQLIQAAIGQSTTLCTPLQMCLSAVMLANKGIRPQPRIVRSIGNSIPPDARLTPVIAAELKADSVFELITDAMTASTAYTYGEYALSQLPSPCAIKTGTPQSPRGYDSAVIGFYPADKPEIAFAVMLEGGANAKHTVYELCAAYERVRASLGRRR
ncbi:MAG: hypothetical protein IKP95_02345 [Ruminococcus sp.]|nr:hypothetical protein [Ruminococcus sp.]